MLKHSIALGALLAAAGSASAAYSLSPWQGHAVGSWADAVAIGDVDGDGRDDVVITTTWSPDEENNHKVFVFFQQSDGSLSAPRRFAYPGADETGLAVADLDGDGREEIIVGHFAGISVLRWSRRSAQATMHTQSYPGEVWAVDVAVVDVDRDGHPDVFAQGWSEGAVVYFGDGQGSFARRVQIPTPADGWNDLEAGDLNADGHDDVVVISGQGVTNAYVYYNDGSDDLSPAIELDPNPEDSTFLGTVAIGDLDGDGRNDLVTARDVSSLSLFRQLPTGSLAAAEPIAAGFSPGPMLATDMDGDGRDDLVAMQGDGVGVYLQSAAGLGASTTYPVPSDRQRNSQSLATGDLNGDGCQDVAIAGSSANLLAVLLGEGCTARADLAINLGLTTSVVAVRLDNFGTAAAVSPVTTVELAVNSGSLGLGEPPAGCTIQSQSSRQARLSCTGASLAGDSSRTVLLPISMSATWRNVLSVSASVATSSSELRADNNAAHRSLRSAAPSSRRQAAHSR